MVKRSAIALVVIVVIGVATTIPFRAAAPIAYRFTFPEPQHRWMQVEATFADLGAEPLELRVSRSSPGRYSLHDFAKNVYDVVVSGADGHELAQTRPDESGWTITGHGGRATVRYKVFGDRVDGTYLAIDPTHAHINMPAAIMWAHGLDDRPATLTFDPPPGAQWQVATQLHPGSTPFEFTAPNLQYLMDSPVEFGQIVMRQFAIGSNSFRFALHHRGTDAEIDGFVEDVEKIVRQERAVYGEFPAYEPKHYTFLADYLPYAADDAMEHRNSTVITSAATIAHGRAQLLDTVAHEFFHGWNTERIRPRSLEPFDFDRVNVSGELWLAEGFTEYYGRLILQRAGLADARSTARALTVFCEAVLQGAGRLVRSAEDMSRMAPFVDGGRPRDRTNWSITVVSYYPFGGAIALALDLTLRERSNGRLTLDDFMRAMWHRYGKPGASREGYVDSPYTIADVEATLAEVSGDRSFARDFLARYVQGHEVADYGRLLQLAGFRLRRTGPGRAWLGDLKLESRASSARVATLIAPTWPLYPTGLEQDDDLQRIDSERITSMDDVDAALRRRKPGDRATIEFVDRAGVARTGSVTLAEDPHVEVVPVESSGGALTPAQQSFRDRWLGAR